jgi:hypothetical protein
MIFLIVQIYLAPTTSLDVDSAWYAQLAYRYLGNSPQQAHHLAELLWCADDPIEGCMAKFAQDFPPTGSPRYGAIFAARPGYPAAVAALSLVTGNLRMTMWAIPMVCTLLAGLGVYWLLRQLGLVPALAAAGQVLFYVLPTGTWGVHALTEGPISACAIATILGGVLLAKRRFALGTVLFVLGLGIMSVIKYSTALPLAALFVVAAILLWWRSDANRRSLAIFGGISAVTVAVVLLVSNAMRLPGFTDTAQDIFTDHFNKPDVPDVDGRMISANGDYWEHFLNIDSNNALMLFGLVVGLVSLFRHNRVAAMVVLATTLTGLALAAAHPDPTAGNRLYLLAWLAVIVGIPVFAHRVALSKVMSQPETHRGGERTPHVGGLRVTP